MLTHAHRIVMPKLKENDDHVVQNCGTELAGRGNVCVHDHYPSLSNENFQNGTAKMREKNNYTMTSKIIEEGKTTTFWMNDETLAMSTFNGQNMDYFVDNGVDDEMMNISKQIYGPQNHPDSFKKILKNGHEPYQPIMMSAKDYVNVGPISCAKKIDALLHLTNPTKSMPRPKILSKLLSHDTNPRIGKKEVKKKKNKQDGKSAIKQTCLKCTICDKSFVRQCDLSRHLNYHQSGPIIQCPSCPRKFTNSFTLLGHKAHRHLPLTKLTKLDARHRPFVSPSGLTNHKKRYCLTHHRVQSQDWLDDDKIVVQKNHQSGPGSSEEDKNCPPKIDQWSPPSSLIGKFRSVNSTSTFFDQSFNLTSLKNGQSSSPIGVGVTCPFCLWILGDDFILRQHIAVFHSIPPMSFPPLPLLPPTTSTFSMVNGGGGWTFGNFYSYFM